MNSVPMCMCSNRCSCPIHTLHSLSALSLSPSWHIVILVYIPTIVCIVLSFLAFDITAGPAPSLDKADRKVIGQVLDQDSMAFLARLSSLPTKKGIKGVIPGANWGPPLLKITVTQVAVKAVGESQSETTVATDGESTA